jgi:glycine/D-amino acid oxidase-like deaminating enzyme
MECDIAIIGQGFWGVAVALKAREHGLDTLVLDDNDPHGASRNAAGLVTASWYTGMVEKWLHPTWTPRGVAHSIGWLTQFGLARTGERFRGPGGERRREDTYMLPSLASLLGKVEAVRASATYLSYQRDGTWRIHTLDGGAHTARMVAVAAGYRTDNLLRASGMAATGVKALRGRALVVSGMPQVAETPYTLQARPYVHYTLRPWVHAGAACYRFGDSVERTEAGGGKVFAELKERLGDVMVNWDQVDVLDGYRPVCDRFVVAPCAPKCVVLTGGHRVGLGVASLAADTALKLLGVE